LHLSLANIGKISEKITPRDAQLSKNPRSYLRVIEGGYRVPRLCPWYRLWYRLW
jgi:hypothetical protein